MATSPGPLDSPLPLSKPPSYGALETPWELPSGRCRAKQRLAFAIGSRSAAITRSAGATNGRAGTVARRSFQCAHTMQAAAAEAAALRDTGTRPFQQGRCPPQHTALAPDAEAWAGRGKAAPPSAAQQRGVLLCAPLWAVPKRAAVRARGWCEHRGGVFMRSFSEAARQVLNKGTKA